MPRPCALSQTNSSLEHLHKFRLTHVANVVPFVLKHDALGADVDLIILAEELRALIWMLQAVLLGWQLLHLQLVFLLLRRHYFF